MIQRLSKIGQSWQRWRRRFAVGVGLSILSTGLWSAPLSAQQLNSYCQITQAEALRKEDLRKAAFDGNADAQRAYATLIAQHAEQMRTCRGQSTCRRTW